MFSPLSSSASTGASTPPQAGITAALDDLAASVSDEAQLSLLVEQLLTNIRKTDSPRLVLPPLLCARLATMAGHTFKNGHRKSPRLPRLLTSFAADEAALLALRDVWFAAPMRKPLPAIEALCSHHAATVRLLEPTPASLAYAVALDTWHASVDDTYTSRAASFRYELVTYLHLLRPALPYDVAHVTSTLLEHATASWWMTPTNSTFVAAMSSLLALVHRLSPARVRLLAALYELGWLANHDVVFADETLKSWLPHLTDAEAVVVLTLVTDSPNSGFAPRRDTSLPSATRREFLVHARETARAIVAPVDVGPLRTYHPA